MNHVKPPFEQVVSAHGGTVLRVCRALLGPGADAEDAWSDTFLAALQAWPQLPTTANVEAWLVTIAKRKVIDQARARTRRAVPTAELPEVGVYDALDDPELWAAVAALPTRQRHAVAYHYFAGLPHKEVAELIGGSTDAVRRAAADGIAALRVHYRSDRDPSQEDRQTSAARNSQSRKGKR